MSGKINVTRELKKLKELLDSEAITPAEYEEQKKRILDAANAQPVETGDASPKKKRKLGCLIPTVIVVAIIVISLVSTMNDLLDSRANLPSNSNNTNIPSSDDDTHSESSANTDVPANVPDLEILDVSNKNDGYVRYATGHIRNNTDRTYSYVQVEINLFNGDIQVGSTLDNVTNLGPGATWEFSAPVIENNATRFEVANVTGY